MTSAPEELARIRTEIEAIDRAVVEAVARRCELARQAGVVKRAEGLPVADLPREASVLRVAASAAREHGLDEELVRQLFWCMVDMSRQAQMEDR